MNEDQKPVQNTVPTDQRVLPPTSEVPVPVVQGNNIVISPAAQAAKKSISPRFWIAGGLVALLIISGSMYGFHRHAQQARAAQAAVAANKAKQLASQAADADKKSKKQVATPPPSPVSAPAPVPTPPTANKAVTKTPSPVPMPAPTPATPWVNTTNCLPQNPTKWQAYYANMTNAQYLQTNGYANTNKLYAALQFAGLIETINTKHYVVLAMDDAQWDGFSQAQLNWMNASPANMRSVLGWQIVTSCITYDGVNPVKDLAAGTTQIVHTLNGPVTFTAKANGLGTFKNGSVGIWDWFTSNGSVTICGFVDTTSIP